MSRDYNAEIAALRARVTELEAARLPCGHPAICALPDGVCGWCAEAALGWARVAELEAALRAWEHLAEGDTSTDDYLAAHTVLTDGLARHDDAENLTDLARRALSERDAARLEGVRAGLAAAAAECTRIQMDYAAGIRRVADQAGCCLYCIEGLDPAAIAAHGGWE